MKNPPRSDFLDRRSSGDLLARAESVLSTDSATLLFISGVLSDDVELPVDTVLEDLADLHLTAIFSVQADPGSARALKEDVWVPEANVSRTTFVDGAVLVDRRPVRIVIAATVTVAPFGIHVRQHHEVSFPSRIDVGRRERELLLPESRAGLGVQAQYVP